MKLGLYKTIGLMTSVVIIATSRVTTAHALNWQTREYASCHLTSSLVRGVQYVGIETCSDAVRNAVGVVVGQDLVEHYKKVLWASLMEQAESISHEDRESMFLFLSTQDKIVVFKGILLSLFDINNEFDSLKSIANVMRYFAELYNADDVYKADFMRVADKFTKMSNKTYKSILALGIDVKVQLVRDTQFSPAFRSIILDELDRIEKSGFISKDSATKAITRRLNNNNNIR